MLLSLVITKLLTMARQVLRLGVQEPLFPVRYDDYETSVVQARRVLHFNLDQATRVGKGSCLIVSSPMSKFLTTNGLFNGHPCLEGKQDNTARPASFIRMYAPIESSVRALADEIWFSATGNSAPKYLPTTQMWNALLVRLRKCRISCIIIDDFQRVVVGGSAKTRRAIFQKLALLTAQLPIALVLTGEPELTLFLRAEVDALRRVTVVPIQPDNEDFLSDKDWDV